MKSFLTWILLVVGIGIGLVIGSSSSINKEEVKDKVNESISSLKTFVNDNANSFLNDSSYGGALRDSNNSKEVTSLFNNNDLDSLSNDGSVINTTVENKSNSKVHGSFKNNTNSCGGCHFVHDGTGSSLLIQKTVGETCMACHDGTLGFYDVLAGKIFTKGTIFTINDRKMMVDHDNNPSTPFVQSSLAKEVSNGLKVGSTSGLFTAQRYGEKINSNSIHNVFGGEIKLKAAPGGNNSGDDNWEDVFDCASCHEPHGSYSDRLLHKNPNGMATTSYLSKGNSVGEGGLVYKDSSLDPKIVDSSKQTEFFKKQLYVISKVPSSKSTDFILVRDTVTNHQKNLVAAGIRDRKNVPITTSSKYFITSGYGTIPKPIEGNVIMVYKWSSSRKKYEPDITPWVNKNMDILTEASYGVVFGIDNQNAENEKVSNGRDGNLIFDLIKGFAYSGPGSTKDGDQVFNINDIKWGHVGRAYVVKLDKIKVATNNVSGTEIFVTSNGALVGGELEEDGTAKSKWGLKTSAGMGQAMSNFCITCHVDYISDNGSKKSGTYSESYRHKSDSDITSCVRCHYSHGTRQEVMRDASEKNYEQLKSLGEEQSLVDDNKSSALKRYVNMSACWGCHSSPEYGDITNSESYYENGNISGLTLQGTWTSGNRWGLQK
ncbi:MAG: doubled protein [Bacillales bacterium]|jgi:hypothetical protein|nr:doubled protein [Bacillales bacterium]